jgi:hypothetical protein
MEAGRFGDCEFRAGREDLRASRWSAIGIIDSLTKNLS